MNAVIFMLMMMMMMMMMMMTASQCNRNLAYIGLLGRKPRKSRELGAEAI